MHFVEFAYKNGHDASLGMSPFEALYSRGCRTLLRLNNSIDKIALGKEMLKEMEQEVSKIG